MKNYLKECLAKMNIEITEEKLEKLRSSLKKAVDAQEYEDAVKLRDQIRALEQE